MGFVRRLFSGRMPNGADEGVPEGLRIPAAGGAAQLETGPPGPRGPACPGPRIQSVSKKQFRQSWNWNHGIFFQE